MQISVGKKPPLTRQLEVAYAGVTSDRLVGGGPELKLSWGTQTLLRIVKKHQTKRILLLILVVSKSTCLVTDIHVVCMDISKGINTLSVKRRVKRQHPGKSQNLGMGLGSI